MKAAKLSERPYGPDFTNRPNFTAKYFAIFVCQKLGRRSPSSLNGNGIYCNAAEAKKAPPPRMRGEALSSVGERR
jgi:hypothetical protein